MSPNRKPLRHDLWAILSSVLTGWWFLFYVLLGLANPPQPSLLWKLPPATSPSPEGVSRR